VLVRECIAYQQLVYVSYQFSISGLLVFIKAWEFTAFIELELLLKY